MKRITLLLFSLLLAYQIATANKVDDLKTDNDVVKFITSLDGKFNKKDAPVFRLLPTPELIKQLSCNGDVKKWGIKNWEKVDLNNDNRTDLLVIGEVYDQFTPYIAMDLGNDTYKVLVLEYSPFGTCEIAKSHKIDEQTAILFHTEKNRDPILNYKKKIITDLSEIDTLVYKFNDFIELNKTIVKSPAIKSIKFETSACFGTCPIFSIQIKKSGAAVYDAKEYEPKKGTFKTNIKSENLSEIIDVLNYINVKSLKNDYNVGWTDYPTCYLTIDFTDGTVKNIKDYGELGTFGLRKVYDLIFALRKNQDWEK